MHVTQIGIGHAGHPKYYKIITPEIADTLIVCDAKSGFTPAFAEEPQSCNSQHRVYNSTEHFT